MLKTVKSKALWLGIIMLCAGVTFKVAPTIISKKLSIEEKIAIDIFINHTDDDNFHEEYVLNGHTTSKKTKANKYTMVLEIPKIGLKKGLYDKSSNFNSVDYGIQILKESSMPSIENGNLILASHRGNSYVSHFNRLNQLIDGDEVIIYYDNVKYTYNIVNYYEIEKNGTARIHRDYNTTIITMITCIKDSNKQIVYIGNMTKKEAF